jgi:hypothetical protein
VILPASKFVAEVRVNDVAVSVIAPFNVVKTSDETPVIITLFDVLYIP